MRKEIEIDIENINVNVSDIDDAVRNLAMANNLAIELRENKIKIPHELACKIELLRSAVVVFSFEEHGYTCIDGKYVKVGDNNV